MTTLYDQFSAFITQNQLIQNNSTVIVGVSGGVDSMVLLHLLLHYGKCANLQIVAVHLNHSLRGTAADHDEMTVREFCQSKICLFHSKKMGVKQYAKKNKLSLEMAGRKLRYALFNEVAQSYSGSLIATAHTLDDQVETILLRIIKGTGLRGLRGIQVKRDNVIRPLLFAAKEDIYQYAKQHKIPYHEDQTNLDISIPRNFIRQTLIPSIRSNINPSLEKSILQLSSIASDANHFIEDVAQNALKHCLSRQSPREIALDISRLKRYFTSVKIEVIRECIAQLNHPDSRIDYTMMDNILKLTDNGQTGNQLRITADLFACIDRNELVFVRNNEQEWKKLQIIPGKEYITSFFRFQTEIVENPDFSKERDHKGIEYIDLDRLGRQIILRPWKESDRITPLGITHSKKISDVFIDQKVPLYKKKYIPILVSDDTIVWVCGLKLSEKYRIGPSTKRALKLIYEELDIWQKQ